MINNHRIAVVIPSYRVKDSILNVIAEIPSFVDHIIVVDDACPDKSGDFVNSYTLPKVTVLKNLQNLGVGGATINGFQFAASNRSDIIVKMDGDGQMKGDLIPQLIAPILDKRADYTKGNRFFFPSGLKKMPVIRKIGNSALSIINKFSSGYYKIMDPTNGFTAIHREALIHLPLEKVSNRFFFESDLLFRLGVIRATVVDVPMLPVYEDEKSNLRITKVLFEFPLKYLNCYCKRIAYNYFIRDFSVGSLLLVLGATFTLLGSLFAMYLWYKSHMSRVPSSGGSLFLAAVPLILGFQMLLSFLLVDVENYPRDPLVSFKKNIPID
ncbi:MAG: glycosyltransferase family 2 protein [Bdellovibrionales bacterium]|nr:glycosyltransferase family 2 protein [Bdellovibrionales bacterium]